MPNKKRGIAKKLVRNKIDSGFSHLSTKGLQSTIVFKSILKYLSLKYLLGILITFYFFDDGKKYIHMCYHVYVFLFFSCKE